MINYQVVSIHKPVANVLVSANLNHQNIVDIVVKPLLSQLLRRVGHQALASAHCLALF